MSRRPRYDVIVVGAGPAGTAAAYYAARGGCRTLLIDRSDFPRAKTCGDALMPGAVDAVRRMGVDGLHAHVVRGAWLWAGPGRDHHHYERFAEPHWPTAALAVPRATLDHALLLRARAAGADFVVGRVTQLLVGFDSRVEGVVAETSEGRRTFHGRVVVAASGSASRSFLGDRSGTRRRVWGVAARTYLRLRRPAGHDLHLHFPLRVEGVPVSGYSWVFPVGPNTVNIGTGVMRTLKTGAVSPTRLLEKFIAEQTNVDERLEDATPCAPVSTAPLGLTPLLKSRPGLLISGDLAGLANAFTGEGIGAALDSGTAAAEAILADSGDVNACYRERLEGRFAHRLNLEALVGVAHEHPSFYLDRGHDLLLRPDRVVGGRIRTIVWDPPSAPLWWRTQLPETTKRWIDHVHNGLAKSLRIVRPLCGTLVEELMADPEGSFGRYAAFGAMCHFGHKTRTTEADLDSLLILEALRMIGELHWDLQKSALEDGEWGCDTVALVLADSLNAVVLARLCDGNREWAGALARQACREMRHAALVASRGTSLAPSAPDPHKYGMAARIALGAAPSDRLPPRIAEAVTSVIAWERGDEDLPLRTTFAELLAALASTLSIAASVRDDQPAHRRGVLTGGTSDVAAR